jgi:hypothetical protein
MPYRIAGIDVHKAMLAVVVADVELDGDWQCNAGDSARAPANCASSPSGWSSRRSRKW